MSSQRVMPSKAIGCSREFSDGTTCGRPVSPVFGAYPEECTSCASRILATKEGFEVANKVIESHYSRLRALTLAAAIPGNLWRVDGIEMRKRFQMLDKLCSDLGARKLMRPMGIASRLSAKDAPSGKLVSEPRRAGLGHMWRSVTPERAIELKKGGFETRYIGVSWQVKVS
jgi:hypothetical protein